MNLLFNHHRLLLVMIFLIVALPATFAQQIDDLSYEELVIMLQNEDSATRLRAVEELRYLEDSRAFLPLSKAVHDADPIVRGQVIGALASVGGLRALPLLKNALLDEQILVSTQAVEAIGLIDHPKATAILVGLLSDKKSPLRNAAAFALGAQQQENAFPTLIKYSNDADPALRITIISVLARLEDSDEINDKRLAAFRMLLKDADITVRISAIQALATIGDEESQPAIRLLLQDEDPQIRRSALQALIELNDENLTDYYLTFVADDDQSLRELAVTELADGVVDEATIAVLLPFAHDESSSIRLAVYRSLVNLMNNDELTISEEIKVKIQELIPHGFVDKDEDIQTESILLAQRFPDISLQEELLNLLINYNYEDPFADYTWDYDENQPPRSIVKALLAIKNDGVLESLMPRMMELPAKKRYMLWNTLGSSNDSRVDKFLASLMLVENKEDKMALINGIGDVITPQRILLLGNFLNDADDEVIKSAIQSFMRGDEVGWQYLFDAMSRANSNLRHLLYRTFIDEQYFNASWEEQADASAIPELGLLVMNWRLREGKEIDENKIADFLKQDDVFIKIAACESIVDNVRYRKKLPPQTADILARLIDNSDDETRYKIAVLLAKCDDVRAIPILEEAILENYDRDEESTNLYTVYINALFLISSPLVLEHVKELALATADFYIWSTYLLRRDDERAGEIFFEILAQQDTANLVNLILLPIETDYEMDDSVNAIIVRLHNIFRNKGISYPAPFVKALADHNPDIRALAASFIGESYDGKLLEQLLPVLHDDDSQVLMVTCKVFAKNPDLRALPALLELMKNDSGEVVQEAAQALGKIGDLRALPALLLAWQNGNKNVLPAILNYKDIRIAEVLAEALVEQEPDELMSVLIALNLFVNEKAVSPAVHEKIITELSVLANDKMHPYQSPALLLLIQNGEKKFSTDVLSLLREGNPDEIKQLIAFLPYIHDKASLTLVAREYALRHGFIPQDIISLLRSYSSDEEIAGLLKEYAVRTPEEMTTVELLRSLKESKSEEGHSSMFIDDRPAFYNEKISAELLKRILTQPADIPQILPTIYNLASTGVGAKRLDAILLSGYITDEKLQSYLISLLKSKRSDLRVCAILALAVQHPPLAHDALIALADSADDNTQEALAYTLGKYADKADFDILVELLAKKENSTIGQTILSIGLLKDDRSVAVLTSLLKDGWPEAARALGNFNDPEVTEILTIAMKYPHLLPGALFRGSRRGQQLEVYDYYENKGSTNTMRHAAMYALRQQGSNTAVDALLSMLDFGSLTDRALSANLLGQLGDRRAVPALISALERFPDYFPMVSAEFNQYNDYGDEEYWGDQYSPMFPYDEFDKVNARSMALTALQLITGQNFTGNVDEWRKWWEQQNIDN